MPFLALPLPFNHRLTRAAAFRVWQSPLLSQQAVTLLFDVFRSGLRDDKSTNSLGVWSGSPPIMFYVMPHLGNTAASWRRQFYGARPASSPRCPVWHLI